MSEVNELIINEECPIDGHRCIQIEAINEIRKRQSDASKDMKRIGENMEAVISDNAETKSLCNSMLEGIAQQTKNISSLVTLFYSDKIENLKEHGELRLDLTKIESKSTLADLKQDFDNANNLLGEVKEKKKFNLDVKKAFLITLATGIAGKILGVWDLVIELINKTPK